MSETLVHVASKSIVTGWDFSTSGVKCLAFDLDGNTVAEVRLPTDLWTDDGVSEINLMQLEGQARASTRAIARKLREIGRLHDWVAGGISATHHTAGRIDADHNQVRRAICWNDQSLISFHKEGQKRLGGGKKVRELIGGPWAIRYSLSHLVKDEATLSEKDWQRTERILSHGSLAAGFLTGNFNTCSVSSAASTGIMDLRTNQWCEAMLGALAREDYRALAWKQLPQVVDHFDPVGRLHPALASELGIEPGQAPLIFPTSDDQQAGLIGGGAVEPGQMAIILGTSAVVNSSSDSFPETDQLDVMKLNWGPYLWMRCYNNGAEILNKIVGSDPDWARLEAEARKIEPGCEGVHLLPFLSPEPSLGVMEKQVHWEPEKPKKKSVQVRAGMEALAYLIAVGVEQHKKAGQAVKRITVSGGVARNRLMCEILATVLNEPLEMLESNEGPSLGAAVTALAGIENHFRKKNGQEQAYTVGDAVHHMVKFRETVAPVAVWRSAYEKGLRKFEKMVGLKKKAK